MKQKTTFGNLLVSSQKQKLIEHLFFNKFEEVYKVSDFLAFDIDGDLNITFLLFMRGIGFFAFRLKQSGLDFIVKIYLHHRTFRKIYPFETRLEELRRDFEALNYSGFWGEYVN